MTEQPAEPITEQEWLQNRDADVRPIDPDELQVRKAQRVAPAPLTPPTPLRPASVTSMSHPYEVAQANVLLRKAITAAAKLQQARKASEVAEAALKDALARENLAEIDATDADRDLLTFTREVADQ